MRGCRKGISPEVEGVQELIQAVGFAAGRESMLRGGEFRKRDGLSAWSEDHKVTMVKWSYPKKVDMNRTDISVSLGVFSEFGSVD